MSRNLRTELRTTAVHGKETELICLGATTGQGKKGDTELTMSTIRAILFSGDEWHEIRGCEGLCGYRHWKVEAQLKPEIRQEDGSIEGEA